MAEKSSSVNALDLETTCTKRFRCTNFTLDEKNLLIHVVEDYDNIIECKKTDKQSCIIREKAWNRIMDEFNELSMTEHRTKRQLKMCYENLKRKIRKSTRSNSGKTAPVIKVHDGEQLEEHTNGVSDIESNGSIQEKLLSYSQGSTSGSVGESYESAVPIFTRTRTRHLTLGTLRRILISKQIRIADMELKMKARKHALELQVEESKLRYYQKKIALLDSKEGSEL